MLFLVRRPPMLLSSSVPERLSYELPIIRWRSLACGSSLCHLCRRGRISRCRVSFAALRWPPFFLPLSSTSDAMISFFLPCPFLPKVRGGMARWRLEAFRSANAAYFWAWSVIFKNRIGRTMSVAASKLVTRPLLSRLKCITNWPSLMSPMNPSGKAGSTSASSFIHC